MAASDLFYIKVLGIQPDFTIDDIVAYFQTARCGSGIVHEVIYLDSKKSAVLIGIEGLTGKASDKLFKGGHKLKGKSVSVRNAKPPTEKQRTQAVFTPGEQSVCSTLPSPQHTTTQKVPSQQEPLKPALKPSHSVAMAGSEQLASQGYFTSTAVQSHPAPWQTTNQVQPVLMSPQVENTQASSSVMDLGSTTGPVDLSQLENMNIFKAAQLLPAQFPIAQPDSELGQTSLTMSEPSLLDASAANVSQSHMQTSEFQGATTLSPSSPLTDLSQLGNQGSMNTRMTVSQQPLTQSSLEQWPALHDLGYPSEDGYMQQQQHTQHTVQQQDFQTVPLQTDHSGLQYETLNVQQHDEFAGLQQSTNAGPQQGGNAGLQHSVHASLQHGAYTGLQHNLFASLQQGAHTGLQQGVHTGLQQGVHTGLQQGAHPKLQQDAHTGPQQGTHTGLQQGAHTGLQQGAHTGLQQGAHTGPQQGAHTGLQQGAHTGPQQGAHTGLQQGAHTEPQQGAHTGLQQGAHTGPQQGGHTGLQQGAHTGLQQGAHTGPQQGARTGSQQGAHTGPQQYAHTGLQQGGHTGPQQGAHTGPQQGAHTGPQQYAHTGLQQGAHTGLQQGAHTGPQQGAHTGSQQGAHTGPQQGAHTGPQQYAHTGLQQGAHTGPQQYAHTGLQQGAHTGPQQGAHTGSQQYAHTGLQQGAHTGSQQGAHTGPQQGAHTGPQQGAHTGPQQGAHTGPQQGAHTGLQQGAHTGPQQGAHTGPQQGAHTGPQQYAHTGLQQGAHTGSQQGAHTGPQQGAHTGPQQGAHTGPQQGAHTGPQQGAHTGPQQGAHTGPQQGAHTGPQQGAHTGPQQGAHTGPQQGAHTGPQQGAHTGPQQDAHTGLQQMQGAHIGPLHSAHAGPPHSAHFGPPLSAHTGPQQGVSSAQQCMGVLQSCSQGAIGNSTSAPMAISLNTTSYCGQLSLPIEECVTVNAPQEWPTSISPSDEGGVVVKVEGVTGLSCETLDLAFDDEGKGGGDIDDIQLKGDIALISFKEKRIATQVASKDIWRVMGRTVNVSLYQGEPDPLQEILGHCTRENTLVLKELPDTVSDEHLSMHLERVADMTEDEDFKLDRKEDTALLKLTGNMAQIVWQKLSSSSRPLVKKTKTMLKVEFLSPADTVIVEGIKDDCCSEEFLEMYFQNKKKSGAGVNVSVAVTGRGQAAITFEDLNVIQSVLSHNHSKVLGQKVSVKLYHPIFSGWSRADASSVGQPQRAKSMQHKVFSVPISAAIHQHLKRTDFMSPLNEKLLSLCGKAELIEKGIMVEPTSGSEWNEQWASQCKETAEKFISSFTELSLDVPPGVMDKVYHVIVAQVHNPNVTISPAETGDQVYLVGSTFDVEELEAKIKKIIYEHLDTKKEETLPVPVLVLIDQCVGQRLKKVHKNVLFETFLQKDKLQVSGKDASCDKFLEDVRKLHPEVIDVRLGDEAVCLLASASGKALLLSKISEQPVGYYFTDADGKLPTSDLAIVTGLHLVSENRKVAINVAKDLQNTLVIHSVDVPEEFKHTVRSQAWRATQRRIENDFIAQLFPQLSPQPENRKVIIACDSMHAVQIKEDLKQFICDVCYSNSTIEMERLQWEYMDKYDKDWKEFLVDIKGSGLKYSLPGATGSAVIKIEGEATPVGKFTRRVHEIRDSVKVGKKEVSKPGAVKHFQSTTGRKALKGIAAEQKAVVEVYTQEEEAEEANRATASLHRKICHGITDDGRTVNIMQGDLTEFLADVIVNAANEQLNHVGGIAGIIVRKGGSIVQEESTKYVERAGQLSVGDAVLLKAVGNLPCKAIVHAVGPRWSGGKTHEEAYLAKAVRNSLAEASKHNYTSIAFPAISSGIFGVPVDICARAMMQGIKEFSALGKPPQLSSITIMLFQNEHISTFTQVASGALKEFSEQLGGCSVSAPHPPVQKKTSSTGPRRPSGVPAVQGLELKKGSLTSYQADVYVNTAHNQLNLNHGAVAQSLLKTGGSTIQDECNRVVATRGTIPYWDIATTSGGNLQCKHIIHTVGANYKGRGCEQKMESMITKVMQECDRLKATSVAFPALGTGNLGFPEKVVAEVMVRTISSYLRQNPRTTVKKVLLVIFMDSTHRAFQQAMAGTPSTLSAVHHVESDFEVVGEAVDGTSTTEVYTGPSEVLYSFSCNRVNVDIVNGDISADDSEGIINTASESLQLHNFGVMGALRRKGGQELQDECNKAVAKHGHLEQHKVIVTGVGRRTRDGLKCLKILHVLAPQYSGGLARTVLEALKRADQEGLRSVALPAIGTGEHGFSSAQAAEGIADGILQFSKSVHNKVASIKVILFQRDQFGSFARAFEEAGKKKGFLQKAFDRMTKGAKWAMESFLGVPPTPHYSGSSQQSDSVRYSETTVLCIKVYAGDTSAIDNVIKEVDLVIAEMIKEDYVKDDKINKLSAKAEADLTRQAEIHHVRMSIDRAPLNQVRFNGERADVLLMKNAVQQELRQIENEENRVKEANLLTSKFQWQWKDASGNFQNYEAMTNYEIQEAYSKHKKSVVIETQEGARNIDFDQKCEMDVRPPYGFTAVRRRDFEQERKEGEHPSSWDPMPIDPGTGREVECRAVQLSPTSKEYNDVANQFNLTMGGGGLSTNQGRIKKIERIQNSTLYAQYIARKKAMDRANPGHQNERQLFHGCSLVAVDSINQGGFNRSYAGQHGTAFGKGVYFARNASYSSNARYAAPDHNGHQHMYLARVLTGEYTTGQGGYIVPPAKDPNHPAVLYDSVVDNVQNPTIFVIFYDPQAYPEYHIEFC